MGEIPLICCSTDSASFLGAMPTYGPAAERYAKQHIAAVGNGAMVKAIASCFDPELPFTDVGAPSEVLRDALTLPTDEGGYGLELRDVIMIGDSLETDIAFANRAGMRSLLVLSGTSGVQE